MTTARPKEALAPAVTVAHVRRRWRLRLAGIAAANVGLTTLTVVACHALGLA